MGTERIERVLELFERCAELSEQERDVLLRRECAGDPQLRREVNRMFGADSTPGFLALGGDATPPMEAIPAGRTVGPFEVVRTIGSGGMGIVLEAVQKVPRRTVALKMLPAGFRRPSAEERFRREIQLLARLEHPGIARVLEAGVHVTEDRVEQPYFAMEYVEGARDLVSWGQGRSLRRRLEIFVEVCDAVQHGHQQGVIHRDLKPANVLVGEDDRPKVIDFGVARALDEEGDGSPGTTRTGEVVGTLEYMAPEQLSGSGQVDTRTDVYSLGLLLHELLCGEHPFDLQGLSIADAAFVIRDGRPRLPRSDELDIPADVGWSVQRALEKEPERRYPSVSEMGADLKRFLSGRPVEAGPPSRLYALRKLIRRQRVASALAALAFVSILVGSALAIGSMLHARASAERSARINGVLTGMFDDTRSIEGGTDIRAVQLLMRAEQRVDAMAADPALEAELRATLTRSFASLGESAGVLRQAPRALALRDRLTPTDQLTVLRHFVLALIRTGRADEARSVLASTDVDLGGRLASVAPVGRVVLGQLRSELLLAEGEPRAAAALLERLSDDARALSSGDRDLQWLVESTLLQALVLGEDYGRAEELADRAVERMRSNPASDPVSLLFAQWHRARARALGDPSPEAIASIEHLLPTVRERFGADHDRTLILLGDLGAAYLVAGDAARAAAIFEEVLRLRKERDGEGEAEILLTQGNLTRALAELGEGPIEETLVAHLEACERVHGPDHRRTLLARLRWGRHLRTNGRLDEAEPWLEGVVERAEDAPSTDRRDLHGYRAELGALRLAQGRLDEAVTLLSEAKRGLEQLADVGDEEVMMIATLLAGALFEAGESADAAEIFLDVLAGMRASLNPSDPRICSALTNLATLHAKSGELDRAIDRFREADAWVLEHLEPGDPYRLRVREGLAQLLVAAGRAEEAVAFYDAVVIDSALNPRLEPEDRSAIALGRARCLAAVGGRPEATNEAYERVIAMERARVGDDESEWIASLEAERDAARSRADAPEASPVR